jgi:hypothetical protein|nr:MAG TPA: hypothetical protein [Caudoviricetes sp.]
MDSQNIITMSDNLTLLQDDTRAFIMKSDGYYMTAREMKSLANKILATANNYGSAIKDYNHNKAEAIRTKNSIELR